MAGSDDRQLTGVIKRHAVFAGHAARRGVTEQLVPTLMPVPPPRYLRACPSRPSLLSEPTAEAGTGALGENGTGVSDCSRIGAPGAGRGGGRPDRKKEAGRPRAAAGGRESASGRRQHHQQRSGRPTRNESPFFHVFFLFFSASSWIFFCVRVSLGLPPSLEPLRLPSCFVFSCWPPVFRPNRLVLPTIDRQHTSVYLRI